MGTVDLDSPRNQEEDHLDTSPGQTGADQVTTDENERPAEDQFLPAMLAAEKFNKSASGKAPKTSRVTMFMYVNGLAANL